MFPVVDFEGGDGCGKSFSLQGLKEYYEKQNVPVKVVSSVPYEHFVENAHDKNWYDLHNTNAKFMQYLSYQVNNYYKNIEPFRNSHLVLVDRYLPSCFAYNTTKGKDPYDAVIVSVLDHLCRFFFKPDITFIFDVHDDTLFWRFKTQRPNELPPAKDVIDNIRKRYRLFTELYGKQTLGNGYNIFVMDGGRPIESIVSDMVSTIDSRQLPFFAPKDYTEWLND